MSEQTEPTGQSSSHRQSHRNFLLLIVPMLSVVLIIGLSQWLGIGGSVGRKGRDGVTTVSWQDLSLLNFRTGQAPAGLKALDGQPVRIPGFIVPLADNLYSFDEFLLVPDPMACIHVPPPPPNQMVYVRLNEPISFRLSFDAVWVEGTLRLTISDSEYGETSFSLDGRHVRPY